MSTFDDALTIFGTLDKPHLRFLESRFEEEARRAHAAGDGERTDRMFFLAKACEARWADARPGDWVNSAEVEQTLAKLKARPIQQLRAENRALAQRIIRGEVENLNAEWKRAQAARVV